MAREKQDVKELREKAINSLVLAIELFNRPFEKGRPEATLILLQHAFEMLLKSIIKDKTGRVHTKGEKYSYPFSKCLSVSHDELKIITRSHFIIP